MFAEIVFPLPFRIAFTYSIPEDLEDQVKTGVRAVAPFGKRTLTGFILKVVSETDVKDKIRPISDILDSIPIFDQNTIKFYEWVAEYYMCSLGEALRLAVPHGSEVESKKIIQIDKDFVSELLLKEKTKNTIKAKLLKEMSSRNEVSISTLQKALRRKNIYSSLYGLQKTGAITIMDEVERPKVQPKKIKFIRLKQDIAKVYASFPEIERRAPGQVKILLELLSSKGKALPLAELLHKIEGTKSSADSLAKKNLVEIFDKEIDRRYFEEYSETHQEFILTQNQKMITEEIGLMIDKQLFSTFLIHGVTGS